MAKLSHNLEFAATWTGVKLARLLPPAAADRLATALGKLAHRLLASRRRVARENIEKALGDELSPSRIDEITRQSFVHAARSVLELARMGWYVKRVEDIFETDDMDKIRQAEKEAKGGVIVMAHYGGFEVIGAWLAHLPVAMNFMTGVQHNPKVNRFMQQRRAEAGAGLLPVDKGVRQVFKVLRDGQFLALISDQHAPSGEIIDFFGRPAATPKGPAAFSVKCGAPVIPLVCKRLRYDRFKVMIGDLLYPPQSGNNEDDVRILTEQYTDWFEEVIRRDPGQWLWTHRRWKV
jgi:KDO2-lipid IV(A) lauroyltransferase